MKLNRENLNNTDFWIKAGIELPGFDINKMLSETEKAPKWVHFGAGNIFRGFIAVLQQKLLEVGRTNTGIIAVAPNDSYIVDEVFHPSDNLTILVNLLPDGNMEKSIIASISESLSANTAIFSHWKRLQDIFRKPSLQIVSFTVTEKGYNLTDMSGAFLPAVMEDINNGPEKPESLMAKIASLVYTRYRAGELPVSLVSMDNCANNSHRLRSSVKTLLSHWTEKGFVEEGCLEYIVNEGKVAFPCTMIDKITPRPSTAVEQSLRELGVEGVKILCTSKSSYISQFVNAEKPQYLVIEDKFPNGRPELELTGVYFADRDTVDKVEKMKVTTCLNPLHTALAVFGCLLGYTLIADEMRDEQLKRLVERIGYDEGMPVVVNPGIIDPREFIAEVLEERLPNPFIPDTPQRIACDTSQKIPVRYGETLKTYHNHPELKVGSLTYIPLVIAGWCRYLIGVDDMGNDMELSPDPLLQELTSYFQTVNLGEPHSRGDCLKPLLSNEQIFGLDLYKAGLGEKIENFFSEMLKGPGAVRDTLKKYVK